MSQSAVRIFNENIRFPEILVFHFFHPILIFGAKACVSREWCEIYCFFFPFCFFNTQFEFVVNSKSRPMFHLMFPRRKHVSFDITFLIFFLKMYSILTLFVTCLCNTTIDSLKHHILIALIWHNLNKLNVE